MKHRPYVTTIDKLSPQEIEEIPEPAAVISYWTGEACPPEEWALQVEDLWGPAGLVMRRGKRVLGTAIFGPPAFFPRAERLFTRSFTENLVFLAYVGGDQRNRKHLLVRALKELRQREVAAVEAIAGSPGVSLHIPEHFLLENGWRPVRKVWLSGRAYTLMRTDLSNALEVGGLARDIIGRVKLPKLGSDAPVPGGACVQVEPSSGEGSTAVLTVETPSGVVA
ncbi:MAG: hypothetical protein ACFB50_18180 [Rubrobacteraceae bacterium]